MSSLIREPLLLDFSLNISFLFSRETINIMIQEKEKIYFKDLLCYNMTNKNSN